MSISWIINWQEVSNHMVEKNSERNSNQWKDLGEVDGLWRELNLNLKWPTVLLFEINNFFQYKLVNTKTLSNYSKVFLLLVASSHQEKEREYRNMRQPLQRDKNISDISWWERESRHRPWIFPSSNILIPWVKCSLMPSLECTR